MSVADIVVAPSRQVAASMSDSETARAVYLRAVIAALGDEVATGGPVTITSNITSQGALDVVFRLSDATTFNERVSRHAAGSLSEAAGDD